MRRLLHYLNIFISDNFLVVAVIIAISVIVGFCSSLVLGEHNPLEKAAEHLIEQKLNLPQGTIDLDINDYEQEN